MILLNPAKLDRPYSDERSAEVMRQTVEFFESKKIISGNCKFRCLIFHGSLQQLPTCMVRSDEILARPPP